MSNSLKWLILTLIILAAFSVAVAQTGTTLYFPVVYKQPSPTPTATATPTNTPTPTKTATPKVSPTPTFNIFIDDIEYNPDEELDEYVDIRNRSNRTIDMEDWVLRDDAGNLFTFPVFSLPHNGIVTVWTKSGANTNRNLYWGRTEPVWNDVSDCAYLRDGVGSKSKLIHQYCYNDSSLLQRFLELLP